MKAALMIGAAICATAAADETYSTFGAEWDYSLPWYVIGQTMTTPDEATVLDSFEFVGKVGFEPTTYTVTVYEWDEIGQHVVGSPLAGDFGSMDLDDDPLRHHDFGVLLPPGVHLAVVLSFSEHVAPGHAVGVTEDVWDGGSAIATGGFIDAPWQLGENTWNDLLFEVEWSTCDADVFRDGMLNIFDFLAFQGLYNSGDPDADFNGDGAADILDFVAFQAAFLNGCGD